MTEGESKGSVVDDLEALRQENERLRALLKIVPAFLGTASRDMVIDYYNFTALDGVVLPEEQVIGKHVSELHWWTDDSDSNTRFTESVAAALQGQTVVLEMPNVHADGRPSVSDIHFVPVADPSGQITHAMMCGLDVTERVRDRDYRSMLLKEVNHRVKNSLQIANSILNLEASAASDENVKLNYRKAAARIMAISKVHDLIYRVDTFTTVPFGTYLTDLCAALEETARDDRADHSIVCTPSDIEVETSRAINLALITNELVTNSFKYAFKDNMPGKVTVTFAQVGDELVLCVRDDGLGMTDGAQPGGTGLGTRLVEMLTRQMGGRVDTFSEGGGFTTKLSFPMQEMGEKQRQA